MIEKQKFLRFKVHQRMNLLSFLESQLKTERSKRLIKKAIELNLCLLNGSVESFSTQMLKSGDSVSIDTQWEQWADYSPKYSIKTVFEDETLLIIDKPPNLICSDEEVSDHFKQKVFLVHRLDKQTSGLLILTKTRKAQDKMTDLFSQRGVEKTYLALVDKEVKEKKGVIENLLGKKSEYFGQAIWGDVPRGKYALTEWMCLDSKNQAALLKVFPKTGRTHQIRTHLNKIGHPILGDYQYCKRFLLPYYIPRVMLHSYQLQFTHPLKEEKVELEALPPSDFMNLASHLKLCL